MKTILCFLFPLYLFAEELIEEAFVTFGNRAYFPLIEVLIESVEAFSSRPIIVIGINDDVPFSTEKHPSLIKRRIDLDGATGRRIMFEKPRILLEAHVRNGVYVDADVILNEGCDALFAQCQRVKQLPLSPVLPWEFDPYSSLMENLGVEKKTMPYVHNPVIIFTEHCEAFLREWHECNLKYDELTNTFDEGIYNVVLWKHGATDFINLCDPYYQLVYDYFSDGTHMHKIHAYDNWIGKIDFYLFHGCKRAVEARQILHRLIKKAENLK